MTPLPEAFEPVVSDTVSTPVTAPPDIRRPVTRVPPSIRTPAARALAARPASERLLFAYPPCFSCRTVVAPVACQSPNMSCM